MKIEFHDFDGKDFRCELSLFVCGECANEFFVAYQPDERKDCPNEWCNGKCGKVLDRSCFIKKTGEEIIPKIDYEL